MTNTSPSSQANLPAKQRIVETAIALFNEHGALCVTTNHISKQAQVSPGTLYYHFRTKTDIIYAIMEKIRTYDEQVFSEIAGFPIDDKLSFFNFVIDNIQRHNWQFRFFKRDMTALCASDEKLGQHYGQFQASRILYIEKFLSLAIHLEILQPLNSDTLKFLANQLWLNIHYWNLHLVNHQREVNEKNIAEVAHAIHLLLLPYFHKSMEKAVQLLLKNHK